MKLVLAHQRGKIDLEQVWPKPIDVKAIRKRVKMSQAEFSRTYGIGRRALQEWEQANDLDMWALPRRGKTDCNSRTSLQRKDARNRLIC